MATLAQLLARASRYEIPQLLNGSIGQTTSNQSADPSSDAFYSSLGQAQAVPSSEYISSYDFNPAMQEAAGIGSMGVEKARNQGASAKRKAFIDVGSPDIAADYGADPNTVEAARQNPFSVLALLRRDAADRHTQLMNSLNSQNLFYSSTMRDELGKQAFGESQAEDNATKHLRELVGGIDRSIKDAAEQDAIDHPPVVTAPPVQPPGSPQATGGSTTNLPPFDLSQIKLPTFSEPVDLSATHLGETTASHLGTPLTPIWSGAKAPTPQPSEADLLKALARKNML